MAAAIGLPTNAYALCSMATGRRRPKTLKTLQMAGECIAGKKRALFLSADCTQAHFRSWHWHWHWPQKTAILLWLYDRTPTHNCCSFHCQGSTGGGNSLTEMALVQSALSARQGDSIAREGLCLMLPRSLEDNANNFLWGTQSGRARKAIGKLTNWQIVILNGIGMSMTITAFVVRCVSLHEPLHVHTKLKCFKIFLREHYIHTSITVWLDYLISCRKMDKIRFTVKRLHLQSQLRSPLFARISSFQFWPATITLA